MGHRIVVQSNRRPEGEGEVTVESYDLRRTIMGVAEGQSEILKETALPQESNIDYMSGIDFRKGCYVGQELTIRTHHTGVVRKRILPVQIYDTGGKSSPLQELSYNPDSDLVLPPRGSNISRVDKKGRSAGKWLGGVGNVGLALCRLEVMTDTVLTGEGSQWNPEHEFKVAWESEEGREGGEVRIKAFVPSWHRGRAEAQKLHRN
jgi:mRNA-decapping enzyme subunit 2